MTFLKLYGLGAVGFTMLVTAMGLQWAVFTESFFNQLYYTTDHWYFVPINIYSLLNALYAVSAVLITFGALIGKISPLQLIVLTVIELACHSFNYKVLLTGVLNVSDMGGTYFDHMFGAYFGLTVAYVLGKPSSLPEFGNIPDIFSLIGTLFLWVYWPSFVGGAAVADSEQQQRALVNTILSLSASTVVAFLFSSLFSIDKWKFRPVDIQNATLAGGVAIGCTANLTLSPLGAILIGAAAGFWSAVGYNHLQPFLENHCGLHDSCGIHNLHAMPSVIGALASVAMAGNPKSKDKEIYGISADEQWWHQLVGILLCISFAIVAGFIVGVILQLLAPTQSLSDSVDEEISTDFHDKLYWSVATDYGKSLYSELAMLIKDDDVESASPPNKALDVLRSKEARLREKALSDWSSHSGRRKEVDFWTESRHGHNKHVQMLSAVDEKAPEGNNNKDKEEDKLIPGQKEKDSVVHIA